MAFLLPFVPQAVAAVASVASAATGIFWKQITEPEEIKADIIKITKGKSVRIIFVGPNGAGKSSLINSFLSAMENKRVKVASSMTKSKTITKKGYNIIDEGKIIITLLDTSGFDETGGNDETIKENIKAAFEGRFPVKEDMTASGKESMKSIMDEINIVVFVYSAKTILGGQQKLDSCLQSLHEHVNDMNYSSMLVLTHADCTEKTAEEEVIKQAREKLGFDASDIHLIKCLIDLKSTRETEIPRADRFQALGVLYAVTNDAVNKKNAMET